MFIQLILQYKILVALDLALVRFILLILAFIVALQQQLLGFEAI